MGYCFTTVVETDFDETIEIVKTELGKEGFGVLTDIDIRATFRKKLDAEFRNYRILGACNPHFAYQALQSERHIGSMLPCNVIVQETEDGQVEVSAIDPLQSMKAVENRDLEQVAGEVARKLQTVIERL